MKYTIEQLKNVFKRKGYDFLEGNALKSLNIIGIRSNSIISNSFDDWLYLIYENQDGITEIYEFPITTDPGTYWLKNPLNVKGTAVLVPNQYKNVYKIGLHQGKYEALKQHGNLKIWRDNDKDINIDAGGKIYEGIYGINIHRSNAKSESSIVEKWSAGCQVFKRVKDFNFLMKICKKSNLEYFNYTLLEEKDF